MGLITVTTHHLYMVARRYFCSVKRLTKTMSRFILLCIQKVENQLRVKASLLPVEYTNSLAYRSKLRNIPTNRSEKMLGYKCIYTSHLTNLLVNRLTFGI